MIAYSLFTIGALHALLMALIERRLHRDRLFGGRRDGEYEPAGRSAGLLAGPLASLPPLLTLERLLFRILTLGFVLLTLTLVTGAIFSEEVFGRALRFDHKTVFAILSWRSSACCSPDAGATAGAGARRCAGRLPAS